MKWNLPFQRKRTTEVLRKTLLFRVLENTLQKSVRTPSKALVIGTRGPCPRADELEPTWPRRWLITTDGHLPGSTAIRLSCLSVFLPLDEGSSEPSYPLKAGCDELSVHHRCQSRRGPLHREVETGSPLRQSF